MTLKTWLQCLLGHRGPVTILNMRRALLGQSPESLVLLVYKKRCAHCTREWEEIV